MKLSKDDIEHVAVLARLDLSPADAEAFTRQVGDILAYAESLSAVDTGGVEPTTHAMEVTNAFREDAVTPSMGPEKALANAPEKDGAEILVPRII